MNLFEQTTRPNELLFYQKNDKNDVRLGEVIKRDEQDLKVLKLLFLEFLKMMEFKGTKEEKELKMHRITLELNFTN